MNPPGISMLILHEAIEADARPDETDALIQVAEVSEAMRQLGWRVRTLPTGLDLATTLSRLAEYNPGCVFNLVESLGGDGRMIHFIPSLLRTVKMPFTGSGSDALYLSSNKLLAKQWMRMNGIATPQWFIGSTSPVGNRLKCIVKSVWEHASLGLDDASVVTGDAAVKSRIDSCMRLHGGDWFAEEFVEGREFNISMLERDAQPHVLPIAEMTFVDYPHGKPKIVGYAAKWNEHALEYHATKRTFRGIDSRLYTRLQQIAYQCWTAFGLQGYARVDVRVDSSGVPWVLEVNANPCLARDAGYTAAVMQSGMTYEQLISYIVQAALRAQPPATRGSTPAFGFTAMPAA